MTSAPFTALNGLVGRNHLDCPADGPNEPRRPSAALLESALIDCLAALRECEGQALAAERIAGNALSATLSNCLENIGSESVGGIDKAVDALGAEYVQWLEETA